MNYSVIVPAYNEERWLPETLTVLKRAMAAVDRPAEIVVVDNNSTDETARVAMAHGARVVFEAHNQISRARNTGARAATGAYLIFLDADTLVEAALIGKALELP